MTARDATITYRTMLYSTGRSERCFGWVRSLGGSALSVLQDSLLLLCHVEGGAETALALFDGLFVFGAF